MTWESTRPNARKTYRLRALPRHYWDEAADFRAGARLGVSTLSPMTGRVTDALKRLNRPSRLRMRESHEPWHGRPTDPWAVRRMYLQRHVARALTEGGTSLWHFRGAAADRCRDRQRRRPTRERCPRDCQALDRVSEEAAKRSRENLGGWRCRARETIPKPTRATGRRVRRLAVFLAPGVLRGRRPIRGAVVGRRTHH
jgi:hypothetical protein